MFSKSSLHSKPIPSPFDLATIGRVPFSTRSSPLPTGNLLSEVILKWQMSLALLPAAPVTAPFILAPLVCVESLNKNWAYESFPGGQWGWDASEWGCPSHPTVATLWGLGLGCLGTPMFSRGTHWLLSSGPCKLTPGSQTQRSMRRKLFPSGSQVTILVPNVHYFHGESILLHVQMSLSAFL